MIMLLVLIAMQVVKQRNLICINAESTGTHFMGSLLEINKLPNAEDVHQKKHRLIHHKEISFIFYEINCSTFYVHVYIPSIK